jgi:hypothetical protein
MLGALLVARGAAGQAPPVSSDAANADSLFTEAKQLMAAGDYATACPKLAESYRLDPGTGTLTALAVCHEHIGEVATAWNEFTEVASSAQRQGRADREAFARQHIAALEPNLSRLTIQVTGDAALIPKLQVRRDSVVVAQPAWGTAVPVDPGDHIIEATAPDKQTWTAHVTIAPDADKKEVVVPLLVDVAPPTQPADETPSPIAPPTPPIAPERRAPLPLRPIGLAVGGAGVASLAIATFFGASAIAKSSDAKKHCSSSPCSDSSAVSENQAAKSDALISDVTVLAGIAALGAGAYLYLTAPKDPSTSSPAREARWRVVPSFGLHHATLSVLTVF